MKKDYIDLSNKIFNLICIFTAIIGIMTCIFLYFEYQQELEFEQQVFINNHNDIVVYEHCKEYKNKYYCYKGE